MEQKPLCRLLNRWQKEAEKVYYDNPMLEKRRLLHHTLPHKWHQQDHDMATAVKSPIPLHLNFLPH